MLIWKGAQSTGPGTYWNIESGERIELKQADVLPGDDSISYLKAPTLIVLASGPLLGVTFAMFLPLVGMIMTLRFLGMKIFGIKMPVK
jgi:hypothetical protein